ncbi:hypothetical protein AMR72_08275 [Flavobacterium psychrophilum]|nr:hypothetical protein AMR72_08275 [Flavobacterium psychrophilum]AOE52501.1 hypothetical protein ALW18_08265 [Flavobacterium psychrophilum]
MLKSDEFKLKGNWVIVNDEILEDEVTSRIKFLTNNHLLKLGTSHDGWCTLYQDPKDSRLWELVYEKSELQGGGSPSLLNISEEVAQRKYMY